MLEVKEICEQLLTRPGPPPATAQEILGLARRDRRHRRGMAAGGATLLVVAASVLTAAWITPASPPPMPAANASSSPSPSPTRRFLLANSPELERMMATLEAALPPGTKFSSHSGGQSSDGDTGRVTARDVSIVFSHTESITVNVFRPHRPIDPRYRANPCRTDLTNDWYGKTVRCAVTTVGQQPVAVGTFDDGGQYWFAQRHYGDWTIKIVQQGRMVLADNELAALVTNAAFLPE